ncbi:thyroid receptor-interacting protein 11-like [Macrosteles quadrilineatus]|uniref:thyroid receptor-interacting protein 11-like n=1 Tax=Macrosteles quadrilineatus TaxID=74068 RepID=UPI0023E2AD17|nr:thyroid receptor-interacting protein 11-like [Macrosteles quadrilineatus]
MAWFGEGFSSLKGQLSNFTKDVATNIVGLSPHEGSEQEESPSSLHEEATLKSHSELEKGSSRSHDKEVARLREENAQLRKILAKQSPRDRRVSEEATLECEEVPVSQLPLVPLDEVGADSFLGQDNLPKDAKADDEISSLRSRLRKTFQEKVLMEQNCSRLEKEVALLTRQVAEDRRQAQVERRQQGSAGDCHRCTQTDNNTLPQTSSSADVSSVAYENNQLRQERAQLRAELARLSRTVQELESQVAVSQDENANLSTGMEELDIQHQEAIEQIMVLKDSTQKRYEVLQAEFEELNLKYEKLVKDNETERQERNSNLRDSDCQTNEDISASLKSQIMAELSEEIKNMITTEIPDKYFETGKDNANVLETVAAVEKMLSHTMARVESSESKIRDLLKELRNKDDELQEIEEENKTLQLKIEEFKEKCKNLPTINENNEDVEVLENKIVTLENEIGILREVRSNLEVEHSNSQSEIEGLVRRLQAAEAMVRNQDNLHTEVSKYKENEEELYKKLSIMEHSRDEMSSEISQLQHKVEEQEKVIAEMKHGQRKLDGLPNLNSLLEEEATKVKELDVMLKKVSEELENEKLLRKKVEDEKEKLFAELKRFENSQEYSSNNKVELEMLMDIKIQLEKEKDELQNKISILEDLEQKHMELKSVFEVETNLKKELEMSLNSKYNEIKLLENEKLCLEQQLEKQTHENDLKFKELKVLNSCLTQKCVKFEKEVLDLSERFDALKIENDSKDRKLCEAILEKSVTDNEMAEIKLVKDNLEKKITDIKSQMAKREEELIKHLKNMTEKMCDTIEKQGEDINADVSTFISVISSKLASLEEANTRLVKENSALSENVKSLLSEVNDKTECILKLSAQMETLHAEKHSIEDRLRNLKEKVSIGNQTDEVDAPKISEELYEELCKRLEEREAKHQELQERYEKLLSSSDHSLSNLNDQLRSLHAERQQLIETVQTKHTECLKYHAEIQRLCAELNKTEQQRISTTSQLQKQLEEKEALVAASDKQVVSLNEQIHTLQNQLEYVSQLLRVTDRQEAEGQPASDTANSKLQSDKAEVEEKEARRVDELYESLQQEQLRNKYLQDEVSEQHEKEAGLLRELERLRGHLVAVEDNYTQEMARAEQQMTTTCTNVVGVRTVSEQHEKEAGLLRELERLRGHLVAVEDNYTQEMARAEQQMTTTCTNVVSEQHEKEAGLLRELERLRGHLVAVEDNYTQEMVRAEQQMQELTQRLSVAEERAKSSSTAYTSASIRANQQVESLAGQVRQLSEQKEKLSAQLATAEDKLHKQQAALTNLQIVLEQFQRDKERDVAMENERIRQTLQQANNKNMELSSEIKALQLQLKEAKEGLSAASRLTEQLDHKSKVITELKQEVSELAEKLKKADERIQAASVSVEGKVDRCLVRNLVVGHLCAPPSSRAQALGVIATVLDFSPEDRQRIGLEPASKDIKLKQQSLSEAFVRFLESESRPQPQLRLPVQETEGSRSRKTSFNSGELALPPARRTSGSVLKDVLKQDL